jgi:hypothetical protein
LHLLQFLAKNLLLPLAQNQFHALTYSTYEYSKSIKATPRPHQLLSQALVEHEKMTDQTRTNDDKTFSLVSLSASNSPAPTTDGDGQQDDSVRPNAPAIQCQCSYD